MTKNYFQLIKKILLNIVLSIILILIGGNLVFAEDPVVPPKADPHNFRSFKVGEYLTVSDKSTEYGANGQQNQAYLKSDNPIASLILQIINFFALTVASLSFLGIIIGGFRMLSSAGNETAVSKGKEILTYAIIGLVITLSAYYIVAFVQNILFETAPK